MVRPLWPDQYADQHEVRDRRDLLEELHIHAVRAPVEAGREQAAGHRAEVLMVGLSTISRAKRQVWAPT
jgi:hypothetical protein